MSVHSLYAITWDCLKQRSDNVLAVYPPPLFWPSPNCAYILNSVYSIYKNKSIPDCFSSRKYLVNICYLGFGISFDTLFASHSIQISD